MKRFFSLLIVAAAALATGALARGTSSQVAAATAPPSPPPLSGVPASGPGTSTSASAAPGSTVSIPIAPGAQPAAGPSAPPEDGRKGLEGVWEVVIQAPGDDPQYNHLKLKQNGSVITGIYLDNQHNNKKYPVAGSVDAKTIHLVVTKDDGTTITLTGQVDGTTDMVGLMQEGGQQVAFTAAYRPKYKFLDTISPGAPGGLGSGSAGGGGYPPR